MTNVKLTKVHPQAIVPKYMTQGASGLDVCACIEKPLELSSLERMAVPTGLSVEIPEGYEIQVRPRSGLSFKQGITVVNAPGTIDSDYRGEIKVLLVNLNTEKVTIAPGDRIAQLVLQKVERLVWEEVDSLSTTLRGAGGFGSTGVSHSTIS